MLVVIQCASTKQPNAGCLSMTSGAPVIFVARPESAPTGMGVVWARPDDPSDVAGATWRRQLEEANSSRENERLCRAFELYQPLAFSRLARRFGVERMFILSAGWGLVRSDYRLPRYDITFSKQAEPYKRRLPGDHYADFNQLPAVPDGPVVFLGGRDYLPLFTTLVRSVKGPVIVPFRCEPSDRVTRASESGPVRLVPYRTTAKTNWHYGCAERLCEDSAFLERLG
ncbi:MAG: hypothetical protein QM767_11305 [Anaeromyxobacter sp.]